MNDKAEEKNNITETLIFRINSDILAVAVKLKQNILKKKVIAVFRNDKVSTVYLNRPGFFLSSIFSLHWMPIDPYPSPRSCWPPPPQKKKNNNNVGILEDVV